MRLPLIVFILACVQFTTAAEEPNVLFIHIDDLDLDEIGAFDGSGIVHSPNLDRLVNSGIKFTRGYVNAPVCVPSRYGTITGKYAGKCDALREQPADRELGQENIINPKKGVVAATIQESEFTLARMMNSAGYTTCMVGKYHNDLEGDIRPIKHIDGDPYDPAIAAKIRANYEETVARVKRDTGFDIVDRLYYNNKEQFVPSSKELQVNNTPWITEAAVDFIREHKEEPFFLYYSNPIPHGRITANKVRRKKNGEPMVAKGGNNFRYNMVERSALATPAGFLEKVPTVQPSREDAMARAKEHAPKGFPDNALITWLDDSIGALLDELESQGLLEETLIVLQSDHQSKGKFTLYEEGARVPFAVSWKGRIKPGGVSESLVGNIDIFATLADVCRATIPEEKAIDGVSFAPLFDDPTATVRDSFLIELGYGRAVVTDDWKYIAIRYPEGVAQATATNDVQISGLSRPQKEKQVIAYPHYADRDQLYNLQNDSREQRNLFANPEFANQRSAMQSELSATLKSFYHKFGEFR